MGKKIFSGVQPTGNLHLGNYLGAIKNFVDLNNDVNNNCIFCVVDLHAITVKQDPKELKNNIRETVATFIASGIDPKKSIIFNQSGVAAHSEGAWILSCVARMGWLNNDFDQDNFLQVPEPLIQKEFSRIMSLKDGSKKMSKSELSDLSRINLTDDRDAIVNKIKKAKTDPLPMPSSVEELNERLEAKNLLGIYSSLNNSTLQNTVENFSGKNFSEFKNQLSDLLVKKIEPISLEIKKLLNDQPYLDKILLEGVEKANLIASKKIDRIKEILGF